MLSYLRKLHIQIQHWSWPATRQLEEFGNERATFVTCMETSCTRLCDPVELRILSAREDRAVRANPAAYLACQRQVDKERNRRQQKAWQALLNHPEAMEKRNGAMAAVAAANL